MKPPVLVTQPTYQTKNEQYTLSNKSPKLQEKIMPFSQQFGEKLYFFAVWWIFKYITILKLANTQSHSYGTHKASLPQASECGQSTSWMLVVSVF